MKLHRLRGLLAAARSSEFKDAVIIINGAITSASVTMGVDTIAAEIIPKANALLAAR